MNQIKFVNRNDFRMWLKANYNCNEGIWLIFDKSKEKISLTAEEALEEALCFGWIDGQLKSVDDLSYLKYFKERRKGSIWSERNKKIAEKLIISGLMTDFGLVKIKQAKEDGTWNTPQPEPLKEDVITILEDAVKNSEQAYQNFMKMAPSARRTYAMHYLSAKSEETKSKRLSEIIGRLEKNLKPMEKEKA